MTFMTDLAIKKKPRPKNLDLTTIRLPLPGVVSILHRVSGAGLFLMLPFILWLFQASVSSAESFETFRAVFGNFFVRVLLLGLLWAYLHHFCAGIRFLLLDFHVGSDLQQARTSSKAVLAVSLALTVLLGGMLLW
jgi:succinate dehydrogenase / fumarate reductase cytochrome b subunit